MYFIISVLIVAALLSALQGNKFSLFAKERTGLLKAHLPYWIFVHHTHLFEGDFRPIGLYVVAIFFFISGYGLETKRKRTAIIEKDFLIKALQKLVIPLIVPIIIYLCLRLYVYDDSLSTIYEEDIKKYQLILPYTWYCCTLFILYVFFYVSVVMSQGKTKLYFSLIVIEILLLNLIGRFIGMPGTAHITTTAFIAGVLFKNTEENIVRVCNKKEILYTLILSVVIIVVTTWIIENPLKNKDIPLTAFVWSILFMTLYAVVPICKQNSIMGRVINSLSSRCYELYICQSIPFLILGAKSQYHPIVYLLSLFLLCTMVAYGCKYVTNILFGWTIK